MTTDNETTGLITRREAILRVSALFGGAALVGQAAMLAGCAAPTTGRPRPEAAGALFRQSDIELLSEIAETILPETNTPGAKAAGVGPFIAMMVTDVYAEDDQQVFVSGLRDLQARSLSTYGAHFQVVTAGQRLTLLEKLDEEQYLHAETSAEDAPAHYFRMIKELTLLGYFTSEIGYTQAMRYTETPGRFDPCVPYRPGEKAWARHA
ncbi:MAG: gluconate 2-dehydrogenase subunit 3 family protein [Gammaproteobacteria bacterium]|nr:gluconate 2-dehydrogenase subunit 3 family protein [Gammaproteobacteria bacterium]